MPPGGASATIRAADRPTTLAPTTASDDWGVDASNITVAVNNGEVTLDGTVSTRLQKRRAEDCAEDVSGVKHVQNNLRVQEQSTWDRNERSEKDTTTS
jgi:osmotically-inducible protein OsmY